MGDLDDKNRKCSLQGLNTGPLVQHRTSLTTRLLPSFVLFNLNLLVTYYYYYYDYYLYLLYYVFISFITIKRKKRS